MMNFSKNVASLANVWGVLAKLRLESCITIDKKVNYLDSGASFPTNVWLQKSASIQSKKDPCKVCPLSADLLFYFQFKHYFYYRSNKSLPF